MQNNQQELVRVNLKIKKNDLIKLKTEAEKYDTSLSNYILFKCNIIKNINPPTTKLSLTVNDIINEVNKLNTGNVFSIPHLFPNWKGYTKSSKLSAPKEFKKIVTNLDGHGVVFVDTTSSNLATYQKKDGSIPLTTDNR